MKVEHKNSEFQSVNKSSSKEFLPEVKMKVNGLPSRGIPYPNGASIKHRPFTFGEIKKISQSKLDTKEKFEFILSGIDCSFDKLDLTLPDFMYIGLLRKISTLGTTEGILVVKCPKCNKEHNERLEIGSAKSKIDFHDMKAPALPIIIEMSDKNTFN